MSTTVFKEFIHTASCISKGPLKEEVNKWPNELSRQAHQEENWEMKICEIIIAQHGMMQLDVMRQDAWLRCI